MIEDIYPLSPLQQGMLFNTLLDPGSGVDIEQLLCELHETLEVAAFQRAWRCVVARHPVLRTNLRWENLDEPLQEVNARVELPWEEQDWREIAGGERDKRFAEFLGADRLRGLALARVPLFRLTLLRYGETEFRLIWTFHHAVLEGRSYLLALREVFAFYEAFRRGEEAILPPPPRPYRDYIAWLQQQDFSKDEVFWRETLKGFTTPTPLVVDRAPDSRPDSRPGHGTQELLLPAQITSALRTLAQDNQLTLNTIVQGAWALLLSRYSGEADVVFGVIRGNRRSTIEGAEAMIGLFLNTLPLRLRVNPEAALLPWLHEVRRQWMAMRGHEHTPLAKVQGWSEVPGGTALFQSTMMFENYHLDTMLRKQGGAWSNRRFRLFLQTNYPLGLAAYDGAELCLRIDFDRGRIDDAAGGRILGHVRTLLEAMVASPTRRISDLPLLTEAERQQLLVEWTDTASDYPAEVPIHELFEVQARRTPEAVAVEYEGRRLTYGELNARANQLAHYLARQRVGPEVLVGICVERSLEMVVGVLGILKAGGAYVPLDPDYPASRLAFMLEDTAAPVLLTQAGLRERLPVHAGRTVSLDADWPQIALERQDEPKVRVSARNMAYVIYTSGSTGRPKGTCIEHHSVVRLVKATNYVELGPQEVFLQLAPISFDASTLELWGSLLNGAKLVVFPAGPLSLQELGRVIQDRCVTTLWLTAALFHQMVDEQIESLRGVRQLLAGGETLSVSHVRRMLEVIGEGRLINGYGPTENTTFTCCHVMSAESRIEHTVPIGRPISNTRVYVLDNRLLPVPVGVYGELYIGGDGLAREYLHQRELTAEKFVADPFSSEAGARLYRSGDLVRFLPDGNIEFLGRIDRQVKIRGFRIELGEIEAVLRQHLAVRESLVTMREDASGDKRLVAYLTPAGPSPVQLGELRSFLKQRLPAHMVPAAFVLLDAFPLTPNGKLDRKALPPPEGTAAIADALYIAPRTPTEEVLAGIWREVLKLKQVGIHDNFFELGGHSLLATQVISRLRYAFDVELPLRSLFEAPTVEHMTALLLRPSAARPQLERRAELLLKVAGFSESEVDAMLAAGSKSPLEIKSR